MESRIIAGVDEAGRGPLAGPVVAAAVILPGNIQLPGLRDSKKLTEKKREILFEEIQVHAVAWAVGQASVEEITTLNILQASLLAMQRAVLSLSVAPEEVWVDGRDCPRLSCSVKAIIQGDDLVPAISAASVMAKVTRDRLMVEYHQQYPEYGFNQHKGYPTSEHQMAIKTHGPCLLHRPTFAGVKEFLPLNSY